MAEEGKLIFSKSQITLLFELGVISFTEDEGFKEDNNSISNFEYIKQESFFTESYDIFLFGRGILGFIVFAYVYQYYVFRLGPYLKIIEWQALAIVDFEASIQRRRENVVLHAKLNGENEEERKNVMYSTTVSRFPDYLPVKRVKIKTIVKGILKKNTLINGFEDFYKNKKAVSALVGQQYGDSKVVRFSKQLTNIVKRVDEEAIAEVKQEFYKKISNGSKKIKRLLSSSELRAKRVKEYTKNN